MRPELVLRRHADHDPELICRPALGYGLCEVLPKPESAILFDSGPASVGSTRPGLEPTSEQWNPEPSP